MQRIRVDGFETNTFQGLISFYVQPRREQLDFVILNFFIVAVVVDVCVFFFPFFKLLEISAICVARFAFVLYISSFLLSDDTHKIIANVRVHGLYFFHWLVWCTCPAAVRNMIVSYT